MSYLSHYDVFAHLNVENSRLYRGILDEFTRAKSRFVIHLRPTDVERSLRASNQLETAMLPESALQQLVIWGNLESHPDTSEVASVEDFWRVRNLYQMSPAGEAAEAALTLFEQSIRQPGELQTAALDEIRRQLTRIQVMSVNGEANDNEVANAFNLIRQRFDELTAQAQRFMGGIQRRIDLQSLPIESFLTYKNRLIDYLERFLRELVMAAHEISTCVGSIEPESVRSLLHRVADREMIDRLMVTDDERSANRRAWAERWDGLCAWFVGTNGRRAQADELRAAARSAIPSLIATVTGINDRRAGHSDRSADFNTLAVWFAQADTDADAHLLWRAAFALHSCRHLSVDSQTLEQRESESVPSTTSWLDAPPIRISPRLHKSGRYTPRGKPAGIIDRTQEKARLAQLSEEETRQIQFARQTLCTGHRTRLSELAELNEMEFQLLLNLLGVALSAKPHAEASVSVMSSDGTMAIELTPTLDGETAVIRTSGGVLIGDDHYLLIQDEMQAVEFDQLAKAGT